ncbi:antirestriction protein ArdA [Jeotgalicoccus halotolerans]|uniref:Antirestriction protein ArdA n=1 Tax=Jeotgalicoccus halotolerans TaxID=157227 RepID=A0A3E0AVT9_9STAP|nr:antirestriction protein ArdA [Jeotgalicoccus halotolerans]REG23801.1 antirestriction protein ArdA [Jeotgalicoccus halotolerans]
MKNFTGMKIAKKYEAGIEEIYKDIDGVWAHAAAGYYFESMDTHTAHEDNQKDLYKVIQTLAPCDCEECENMKAADEANEIIDTINEGGALEINEEKLDFAGLHTTKSDVVKYEALAKWTGAKGKQADAIIEDVISGADLSKYSTADIELIGEFTTKPADELRAANEILKAAGQLIGAVNVTDKAEVRSVIDSHEAKLHREHYTTGTIMQYTEKTIEAFHAGLLFRFNDRQPTIDEFDELPCDIFCWFMVDGHSYVVGIVPEGYDPDKDDSRTQEDAAAAGDEVIESHGSEAADAEQFIDDHVEIVFVTDDDDAAGDSVPLERPMPLYDEDINSADISVWIGSIGAYNSGELVGMWTTLPKTDDEIADIIHRVNTYATLATIEPQEETEIMDINFNVEGFTDYTISGKGLSELNDIAQQLEDMDDYDKDNLPAITEVTGDIMQAIEAAADAIILDDVSNDKELGEALNEHGFLTVEIPSHLENYIDWEAIGRDYRLDGAFTLTSAGQAVNLAQ